MSLDSRLREALDRPLDGEAEAERRAWAVVSAVELSGPVRRRRVAAARLRPLGALGGAVLVAALALTPPGEAVSDWVAEGLGIRERVEHRPSSSALGRLPGGGELLVGSRDGSWVVRADGSRRRVGPYRQASWSPNGLFVAAVRGDQLVAATPRGEVRWAITREPGVGGPRWAPSGLRIAYVSGSAVRIVAGDGTEGSEIAGNAAATPPAWRRGAEDELAFADRGGRVTLVSAVTGRVLWRSDPGPVPASLSWSRDGGRLAASSPGGARILDGAGRLVEDLPARPGATLAAATFAPRGRRLALVENRSGGAVVTLADEPGRSRAPIFATAAPLSQLQWSPDGRWLLVASPRADQWLFLRDRPPHRVVAVSGISEQFDPAGVPPRFPRLSGWCCAP